MTEEKKSTFDRIIAGKYDEVEAEAKTLVLPTDIVGLTALLVANGYGTVTVTAVDPPEYIAKKTKHLLESVEPGFIPEFQYLQVKADVGKFGLYYANLGKFGEHYLDLTGTEVKAVQVEPDEQEAFGIYLIYGVDVQVCAITLDLNNVARFAELLKTAKKVTDAKAYIKGLDVD